MKVSLTKIHIFAYSLLIFVICFYKFKDFLNQRTNTKYKEYNMELLGFQKNETKRSSRIISDLQKENTDLKDKLKDPEIVKEIKYVIKTKYQTEYVQVSLSEIPAYQLILDSNNIPSCEFKYDQQIDFISLPKKYSFTTILLDNYNYTYLIIEDYQKNKHKIELAKTKLETQVIQPKPQPKRSSPSLSLGINANLSDSFSVDPTLNLNLLTYGKHSFASPSYLFSSNAIGLELYSYNIGDENKILKDTWIGLTYHLNTKNYYGLNVSTRF